MNIKSTSPTFPHSFPYQQPQTLQEFIEAYLEHLLVVNYSPQTVESQTNQATALLLQILRTAGDPPTGTGRLAGSQRFSNSHPPLPETRRQAIGRWQATH